MITEANSLLQSFISERCLFTSKPFVQGVSIRRSFPLPRRLFYSRSRNLLFSSYRMDASIDLEMNDVQRRLMFEDECILVNGEDNIVGHDSKYNCHLMEKIQSENMLHRAFSVFLFNSKYELLLQDIS